MAQTTEKQKLAENQCLGADAGSIRGAQISRYRIVSRARKRAEQLKREHPLQLLAVVTGTAFAIGMAVRIWRSRHHA